MEIEAALGIAAIKAEGGQQVFAGDKVASERRPCPEPPFQLPWFP